MSGMADSGNEKVRTSRTLLEPQDERVRTRYSINDAPDAFAVS